MNRNRPAWPWLGTIINPIANSSQQIVFVFFSWSFLLLFCLIFLSRTLECFYINKPGFSIST